MAAAVRSPGPNRVAGWALRSQPDLRRVAAGVEVGEGLLDELLDSAARYQPPLAPAGQFVEVAPVQQALDGVVGQGEHPGGRGHRPTVDLHALATVPVVPLRWETPNPGLGPTLGYDAAGVCVARVVRRGNGWEAWYDRAGLERPAAAPFGHEPAGMRLGHWASAGEARTRADRHHDRLTRDRPT